MTNATILNINDVNIDLVNIKKPYRLTDNTVFDIKYNNTPFLIQTPLCVLRYKPAIYDNGYMQINVHVILEEFRQFIQNLEGKITSKLSKKYSTITGSFVRFENDLKLRSNNYRNVKVFDAFNNSNDIHALTKDEKLCFILHISKILSLKDKAYIMYEVMQIKRCEGFQATTALFTQQPSQPHQLPSEYDKFLKMHKVGIPVECIRHKMNLEGMSLDKVNKFFDFINPTIENKRCAPAQVPGLLSCRPPPPPPPLPPPRLLVGTNKQGTSPLAFLNDIKNKTFTLKKVPEENGDNAKVKRILQNVDMDKQKVPSLQEILAAKDKLKKHPVLMCDKPPPKEFYAMPFHKDIKEFAYKLRPVIFKAKTK